MLEKIKEREILQRENELIIWASGVVLAVLTVAFFI